MCMSQTEINKKNICKTVRSLKKIAGWKVLGRYFEQFIQMFNMYNLNPS